VKKLRWKSSGGYGWCVSNRDELRNKYKILCGEPEGKRPLTRSGHKWENNIKVGFKETVCEGVGWIHVA
jgi:hypothetical protein